ncbi:MAG: phospholipase/carboxylesterase [Kribbellaceae bacterium]|nr:phospholipase/carboxylesterase [Kribbellaceae bacterium]
MASLRAPIAEAGGYAWFPSRGNPIGDPQPDVANARTDAVLEWLDLQPSFPSVGVLGFSQGGAMALQLLRRHPARFAYAIQLAGFVVADSQPGDQILSTTRPPVFWGRGARDGVIPPAAITRTTHWMAEHTEADIQVYPGLGHDGRRSDAAALAVLTAAALRETYAPISGEAAYEAVIDQTCTVPGQSLFGFGHQRFSSGGALGCDGCDGAGFARLVGAHYLDEGEGAAPMEDRWAEE